MPESTSALNAMLTIQANTAQAVAQLAALNTAIANVGNRTSSAGAAAARSAGGFATAGRAMGMFKDMLAGFAGGAGFAMVSAGVNNLMHGIAQLGHSAVNNAADMEAMKFGLASVNVSLKTNAELLKELNTVALLPGLDLRGAIRGSVRLQAAGLSADQATRALMSFGNALATVGGGREELNGVMIALTQIASKTRVSAEEINQLGERLPQIRSAMFAAFGTADTEKLANMGIDPKQFIERIIREFEKLPKVMGGIKVLFENVATAWFKMSAAFGDPIAQTLARMLNPVLENMDGIIQKAGEMGDAVVAWVTESGPQVVSFAKDMAPLAVTFYNIARGITQASIGLSKFVANSTGLRQLSALLGEIRKFEANSLDAVHTRANAEEEKKEKARLDKRMKEGQEDADRRIQEDKAEAAALLKAEMDLLDFKRKLAATQADYEKMLTDERFRKFSEGLKDMTPGQESGAIRLEQSKLAFGGDVDKIIEALRLAKEAEAFGGGGDAVKKLEAQLEIARKLRDMENDAERKEKEAAKERKDGLISAAQDVRDVQIEALKRSGTAEDKAAAKKLEREKMLDAIRKEHGKVLTEVEMAALADAKMALGEPKANVMGGIVADSMASIGGGGNVFDGAASIQERQATLLEGIKGVLEAIYANASGRAGGYTPSISL